MAQWRYKLNDGKYLRECIDNEDIDGVLMCLENMYREINEHFPDEYDEYRLEDSLYEINNVGDEMYQGLDGHALEEEVNYLLGDFYDLCDEMDIWVEI